MRGLRFVGSEFETQDEGVLISLDTHRYNFIGAFAATLNPVDPSTVDVRLVSSELGQGAVLSWGNNSVAATTTTRFLLPWFDDSLAPIAPTQWRVSRSGTIRNMRVRHTTPAGNGNLIVYALRVNGVATLLAVSLASTAVDGSNLVNTVVVVAGDLVDIIVTKALAIGASPLQIMCTMEFA